MSILEILAPRFDRLQLKGFRNGFFDETGTKFFAYTLLSVKDEEFDGLYDFYLHNKGHAYIQKLDDEIYRIYNNDGTYRYKDVKQLVQENIFKYVMLRFCGALYKEEWYVLDEWTYFDEENENEVIKKIEETWLMGEQIWLLNIYKPLPEFEEEIDYGKVAEAFSAREGREIDKWEDRKLVYEYLNRLQRHEIPKVARKQYKNFREFTGQPWLVAYIKQEKKSKMNRTFDAYMNEAIFIPLVQRLKNTWPDEFSQTETLFSADYYSLIYPHTKEQVLCIVKAINKEKKSRLYYFLYIPAQKQLFQWTKPIPQPATGHYAWLIEQNIENLSTWGNEFDLHEPSITMDDPHFWNEHVFKKEGDEYVYLKRMDVQNNQRDIYPL